MQCSIWLYNICQYSLSKYQVLPEKPVASRRKPTTGGHISSTKARSVWQGKPARNSQYMFMFFERNSFIKFLKCFNSLASLHFQVVSSLWNSQFWQEKRSCWQQHGSLWQVSTLSFAFPLSHPDVTNDFCCCSCSRYFWTWCKYIWYVSNPQYLKIWKQNLQNN